MPRKLWKERGAALLLSLAVLVILSILAVSFVRLANMERAASNNYVHRVRAKFASRAGLRMATGGLVQFFTTATVGTLDKAVAPWIYGDAPSVTLDRSLAPSFLMSTTVVDGVTVGYSGLAFNPTLDQGWLPPSYDPAEGIQYVLKVVDLNTRINLNDPNPNMATMLNNLGVGINTYDPSTPNPVANRGAAIVGQRDGSFGGRFRQLEDLASAGLTKPEIDALANYVTVDSWRDTSVLRPRAQTSGSYETYNFVKPTFPDTTVAGRAPININTCPMAVLYAMLVGLRATGFRHNGGTPPYDMWTFGGSPTISPAQAQGMAAVIDTRRRATPIQSQFDLARLLRTNGYAAQMGIVMANCNPNTKLTKFNADLNYLNHGQDNYRSDMFDKTDLTYWTTEACFIAHGYFQYESMGRVVSRSGNVLARHTEAEIVKVFDVIKHTTQSDFETNQTGGGHTLTKTYPESMADQGYNNARASQLDGQIALDDDSTVGAGTIFQVNNDSTLLGPDGFRWHNTDMGLPVNFDLLENNPPDGAQNPLARTILGEDRPAALKNSTYASNLLPDGHWSATVTNNRMTVFGAANPGGTSHVFPDTGSLEYWFKGDCRQRNVLTACRSLTFYMLFDKNCPIPAGPLTYISLYWSWLKPNTLNGGIYGGNTRLYYGRNIWPQARRNMDSPDCPYNTPAGFYTSQNVTQYKGQVWNHIRLTWTNWINFRVYLNNSLVGSATAYFWGGGVLWDEDNRVDFIQFGNMYYNRPPSYIYDYRSSMTMDGLRVNRNVISGMPDRFRPSAGGSNFTGRFTFPSPPPGNFEALSIRFTSYPGVNQLGGKGYVGLRATAGSTTPPEAYTSNTGTPGPAAAAFGTGVTFDPSVGVSYTARFYTGSQAPITATPYFDDVTLFYRVPGGTQTLRRWSVE